MVTTFNMKDAFFKCATGEPEAYLKDAMYGPCGHNFSKIVVNTKPDPFECTRCQQLGRDHPQVKKTDLVANKRLSEETVKYLRDPDSYRFPKNIQAIYKNEPAGFFEGLFDLSAWTSFFSDWGVKVSTDQLPEDLPSEEDLKSWYDMATRYFGPTVIAGAGGVAAFAVAGVACSIFLVLRSVFGIVFSCLPFPNGHEIEVL